MELVRQVGGVAVVLGLLALTLWWLRRRGFAALRRSGRGAVRLEHLERLSLGPQHTLHLVRVDNRSLLVASSPAGCALLERLPGCPGGAPGEASR